MAIRNVIIQSIKGEPYFTLNTTCGVGKNCDLIDEDGTRVGMNAQKTGGIIAALNSMVQETVGDEVEIVEFGKITVLLQRSDNLISIFNVAPEDDVEEMRNKARITVELFLKQYGNELDNWTGNPAKFDEFQTMLEKENIFNGEPAFRKNCIECMVDQNCIYRMMIGPPKVSLKERWKKHPKLGAMQKMKLIAKEMINYKKQMKRFKSYQASISS